MGSLGLAIILCIWFILANFTCRRKKAQSLIIEEDPIIEGSSITYSPLGEGDGQPPTIRVSTADKHTFYEVLQDP